MQPAHIYEALKRGGRCDSLGSCYGPQTYAELARSGWRPSRYEVGCLIPMQHSDSIPPPPAPANTVTVALEPRQEVLPVAAVLDFGTGADIIIDSIVGPDGDAAGIKGDGIGPTWDPAGFSYEALRSCVNPFPRDVGIIDSSQGLEYTVTNSGGAAQLFGGITWGHVAGEKAIEYMRDNGMISKWEGRMLELLAEWCESGTCPKEIMDWGPTGKTCEINGRIYNLMHDGSYSPL